MYISQGHNLKQIFYKAALTLILSVLAFVVSAQSDKEVMVQADKHFQQENYAESMRLYSQLLSLHRNDPFYSYRFGVSMLYSDRRDPNSAIRYIELGLGKLSGDDAVLIHFHLGTAYHLNFRFIEALRQYNIFKDKAVHKKFASYPVNHRIDMCRNGVHLLQNIRDLYVFEKHHVPLESFFRSYSITKFGGKLLIKPDVFKSKFDKKLGETTIIFLSDTQQVVYYSSYGRDGKSGKDIYRSYKQKDGSWGNPEKLSKVVNTEFDEDYPFILPDGKTLYFSSKGHNSMGGYDIFRTTWDEMKKEWTTPVNLDFAINTPYDDILFVTDADERYAYFSSVRYSGLNQINVFLVRIDERPDEYTNEALAVVTDLAVDIDDPAYVEAVQKVQQISSLDVNASKDEFDRRDEERRKQLYADNYKYNISENPTSDELIDLSFKYAGDAERSFLMLRQKRQATEISADKSKNQAQKYSSEADRLFNLAVDETDPAKKQLYNDQALVYSKKAAEAEVQYLKAADLTQQLVQSIDFQKAEFDRILLQAGEIQRLASGRQIDTSVVLLKKMIDDISTYEIQINEFVAQLFPTEGIILEYRNNIEEARNEIIFIDDTLKALAKERELYQNELFIVNDPERRQNLMAELRELDDEIMSLQQQKTQRTEDIVNTEKLISEAEFIVNSPDYQLYSDVLVIEEILATGDDEAIQAYVEEVEIIPDNRDTESTETTTTETTTTDVVEVPDNRDTESTETTTTETTTTDVVEVPDNRDTESTETTTTEATTDVVEVPDNRDTESTETTTTETTTDIVEVPDNRDTESTETTTTETTTTDIVEVPDNRDTESTETTTTETTTDIVEVPDNRDTESTETATTETTTDIVEVPDNRDTESTETNQSDENDFLRLTTNEKQVYLEELINSDVSVREKIEELVQLFELEQAVLIIKKQKIESDIAGLIQNIEQTERSLTDINGQLTSPSLSAYEKRQLENQWKMEMLFYRQQLTELEQLFLISEYVSAQVESFTKVSDEVFSSSQQIFSFLDEGNEKKAGTEFIRLTSFIEKSRDVIFQETASIRITVKEEIAQLNNAASRQTDLGSGAENKAIQYSNKAAKTKEKASGTKNQNKKQQLELKAAEYESLAQQMRDSVVVYRQKEQAISEHAVMLTNSDSQFLLSNEIYYAKAVEAVEQSDIPEVTELSYEKMQRMHTLIAEHPVNESFEKIISASSQWTNAPDEQTELVEELIPVFYSDENHQDIMKTISTSEDVTELKAIADKQEAYILRSSATLTITSIKMLEDQMSNTSNPEEVYAVFQEINLLKEELHRLVKRYNDIASEYPDLEIITETTIPLYDEIALNSEPVLFAFEKYRQLMQLELDELKQKLTQITDNSEKENIMLQIEQFEAEIIEYQLRAIEIMAVSERSNSKLLSILINSIPYSDVEGMYPEKIAELKKQYNEITVLISKNLTDAVGLTDMEARKINYIQTYEFSRKAMEYQQEMFELYRQYISEGTDPALSVLASVNTAFENQPRLREYLGEVRAYSDTSFTVVVTEDTSASASHETLTSDPPVRNESLVVTDRTSEEFVSYYSETNPIPSHSAPDGLLLFRVQIAASRRPAADNTFEGMSPLFFELAGGWYRYMHGEFSQLDAAIVARNQLRTLGYPDAFVVAYYNGQRISIAEARVVMDRSIEIAVTTATTETTTTETYTTEAGVVAATSTMPDIPAGTVMNFDDISGFYFAVQIGVYATPRTSERLFGITPLIEGRMPNGNYRYMTGVYASFEEATRVRDRIRAIGVPDAYVVAYRDGRLISVREAQELIDGGTQTNVITPVVPTVELRDRTQEDRRLRAENIYFKVQLGAFRNEVPAEVMNAFVSIADEIVQFFTDQNGLYVYTAGNYKSFEEAEKLKIQIIERGINDAFVIAMEGGKKISLQEANEILEIQ